MTEAQHAVVVTHFPSPYQVELFNEVERQRPGLVKVLYLFRKVSTRSWSGVPITHAHAYLDEGGGTAAADVRDADCVVFNYYNDGRAAQLIRARAATGRPWCFWGERPGYRFPSLARLVRLGRLTSLRGGRQPIWGIGQWAVDAYRSEFGSTRSYLNLPYYSDLRRFQALEPVYAHDHVTFLFSGALSHRKGVDLLASAFVRLSSENARVRLMIMGQGPLEAHLRGVLGTHDRVEWVGFKDWDDLPSVYQRAHVLVVPSRHDGWGLVVPEGLAAGLPTISTTRTGAALDLLTPNSNGWLIAAGDGAELYRAMKQAALLSETDWLAMSRGARCSIADHSLTNGAGRLLRGVASVIANRGVA
jgi:glycosyltransferase involved in cell wall biosynthesis